MPESIRSKYSSQTLNQIIRYFMRTILHFQNTGIEHLPLKHAFEEPIRSYLDTAMELIIDGQPPQVSRLILDAEYDALLGGGQIGTETALCLRWIKEASWHMHYDQDCYEYLLSTDNLWGNDVLEYAARTFYPNLPQEIKEKYQILELIKYIPPEIFRLDDY